MPMTLDVANWTGEGTLTPALLAALQAVDAVEFLRLEDAPASRAESGYALISNEFFVRFRSERRETGRRFAGLIAAHADVPVMTLSGLSGVLAGAEGVGAPDYADEGMLQYLRTETLVAPYQTKGVKVVELVRIYEAGTAPRR